MSIDAMKQMVAALRISHPYSNLDSDLDAHSEAIAAGVAAIEASERQEPVAWMGEYNINDIRDHYTVVMRHKTDFSSMPDRVRPLYTAPHPAIPADGDL